MTNKCLSDFSYNEEEFQKTRSWYENALTGSVYKSEMKYEKMKG